MIDTILGDRPLGLEIKDIVALPTRHFDTVFRIRDEAGKVYKLRVCTSPERAELLANRTARLDSVMPRLCGRDRHYLVSEFLNGERLETSRQDVPPNRLKERAERVFSRIGEMMATAHQYEEACKYNPDEKFHSALDACFRHGIFSVREAKDLVSLHEELRQGVDYQCTLDLEDTALHNFMVTTPERDIYFIDEEGVGTIRGVGLTRLVWRLEFRGKDDTRLTDHLIRKMFDAYEQASPGFLTREYLQLISIFDLVRRIEHRAGKKRDFSDELELLRAYHIPCAPTAIAARKRWPVMGGV